MNFGEQFARAALESLGYFIIQGFKVGVREADFLAVKRNGRNFKFFHIEAQISWSPSGVLRGQAWYGDSAKNWRKAARDFAQKKFFQKKVLRGIKECFGTGEYEKIFIYGKLKEFRQISVLEKKGIKCVPLEKLVGDAAMSGQMTKAFTEIHKITNFSRK